MTIRRETGRCAEKYEKVGGVLRYTLIGALGCAKLARKAQEGGSHKGREGGSALKLARARKDFQSVVKI